MHIRFFVYCPVLIAASLLCLAPSECSGDRQVTLTVYNQDLALVRDVREISLEKGVNDVLFGDVPAKLDPTSVRMAFVGEGTPARVLSQRFDYDTADFERLLALAVGREVTVRIRGGELFRGVLSGYDNQALIVREETAVIRDKDEMIAALRREHVTDVSFPDLGADLVLKPSLAWRIEAGERAEVEAEVSYLTKGMTWSAEYVAVVEREGGPMEISAWASLSNTSGGDFEDASLTLIAGRVLTASREPVRRMEMMAAGAPSQTGFEERDFFEYHAYSLDRAVTLRDNEDMQVPLFPSSDVEVERTYTYDATRFSAGVKVSAETENTDEMGLGKPLPGGRVRVYAAGLGSGPRLVGEEMLDNTPVGAEIELSLGVAFDVEGERKRTSYVRHGRNDYEESYEIKLRNSKSHPVDVRVVEHPRGDWTITETSHAYEEKDSDTVRWTVTVPASGEATVSYTVQFRS